MKKFILTFAAIFLVGSAFAQTARFEDLKFFDRIVVKGNVSKVIVEGGEREVIVEGVSNNKVTLSRNAGIVTLEINSSNPVEVSVSNSGLKWIEAPADAEIEGVEYLKGGKGTYLVTSKEFRLNNVWEDLDVNVEIGDMDFDFDWDFDMDFDFDFDFDYDYDYSFDFDLGNNFKYEYKNHPKKNIKVKTNVRKN